MAGVHAFRGIRYDLGHVGELSNVVAPPYDVIGPDQQDELYKRHPANVIRLILNRDEPGDDEQSNRYTRAAHFFKSWQSEGVLQKETQPAIYVYHQIFTHDGQQFVRRGYMAAVTIEPFGEGNIFPHEETHSAAKEDRLKLIKACQANMSQIFGLYPDDDNQAQELLEAAAAGVTPVEATDHLGVVHRVWPITDLNTAAELSSIMGPKALFIADGHHRYETACNYRQSLADQGELRSDSPAHSVLMMCVSMNDPGMIVLPTHRLFRGLPGLSSQQLMEKLGAAFRTEVVGTGPQLAESVWTDIEVADDQGQIGLYTAKDDTWVLARITEAGQQRMAEVAGEQSSDWQGLGVSILHRLIVETLLGVASHPKPKYVHLVDEVVSGIQEGDEDGSKFPLAALVMPATLDHIRAISQHGERMPAKSTYFYPKLLSGLVFNPLK